MRKPQTASSPTAPSDRIVGKGEIVDIVHISISTIYRLERSEPPGFPRRLVLARRRTGWRLSEVMSWLADREQRSLARSTNYFNDDVRANR